MKGPVCNNMAPASASSLRRREGCGMSSQESKRRRPRCRCLAQFATSLALLASSASAFHAVPGGAGRSVRELRTQGTRLDTLIATNRIPSSRLYGVNDGSWLDKTGPRKGKRSKEELEMEKQEKEAVKKYLEQERKRQEESRRRAVAGQAKNPVGNKKNDKEAPWATKTPAPGQPQPNKPKAPKPRTSFQQISLTTRQFSIDDVQSLSFEGSHLEDVPYLGLPEVAVFGRSNVGKSSLLNCLAGTNKGVAVVSKTPGRTQAINLFKVHDSAGPVAVVVDLPGYGYAKLPKALQTDIGVQVRKYLSDRPTLRLAVLLLDSRREPQRSDLNMIRYFRAANVPLLVLATKIDKLKPEEVDTNLDKLQTYFQLPEGQPVPFSSVTALNKRTVWLAIRDACMGDYQEQ